MSRGRRHSQSNSQSTHQSKRSPQDRSHDQQLDDAAHSSRLHARGLCQEEFELFQHHLGRPDLESYLKVRNTMLWLWRESPKEPLTFAKAFEATKDHGLHHGLIAHVFEFLLRSGYINYGLCPFQEDSLRQDQSHHAADPASAHTRKMIVVVGSGIAGVAVARQLENLFHYYAWRFAPDPPPKVIVLEAKSRIGGRMHSMELNTKASSLSKPSSPPLDGATALTTTPMKHAVDLGAQIITGFENGNPMEVIVRRQLSELKLKYLVNQTCDLFGHDGKLVTKTLDVHCETVFNQILERACQLRDEDELPLKLKAYLSERNKWDGKGPGRVQSTTQPTLGHSMDFFMESHPERHSWTSKELGLIHWHYANLEVTTSENICHTKYQQGFQKAKLTFNITQFANATPLDQLSLRYWDQDDDYEFSGSHCMVVQGYGQVPVLLSEGLDIRLDMPVSSIKRLSNPNLSTLPSVSKSRYREPVQIQCRNGATLDCTAAVITVPLGVLKSQQIKFTPQLPTWKEQAIKNLGFGLLNKLVLVFENSFWDSDVELFGYVGSRSGKDGSCGKELDLKAYRSSRGKFYMFWNCAVVAGLPMLVTLMAGQSAYDCELIPKEELVREALETLALIFSHVKPIPTPIETIVTRWSQDEFAQGSYSFVAKEATGEDYDLLAKPVDRQLYFAGEATSRHYPATAHGAYLSGIKAAKDILDSLIGPQVVDSSRHKKGLKRSNDGDSGNETSSRNSPQPHLMSLEDANDPDSPRPTHHGPNSLSFMSLGHGFVVPRRRGRVCRSLIAKFVAQRSDSEDDSDVADATEEEI
ncbi:hypothetical protein BGZ80_004170 [Entomortierella chlamydospora]|uniref:SWIRM domain-containing protein n=1 Tax=Entomortierella chlamydospora TaxID=101097 RepID=A0A9P6SW72_9FUNG|nr:hypothetical protein BGZ79_010952 [Entomortierella chlamydospora]KAG0007840.1 hypothetical protein BGZ80_004170 [Entomortierella chlamydospora]